jgi:hypothetical protein
MQGISSFRVTESSFTTQSGEKESFKLIRLTGTVGGSGKYLVTGIPVDTQTHTELKLTFENNTAGTNLALCAGTNADFIAGTPGLTLSDSGGPGFQFLTIIDTQKLFGKFIYVLRQVGSANSQFTLIVE